MSFERVRADSSDLCVSQVRRFEGKLDALKDEFVLLWDSTERCYVMERLEAMIRLKLVASTAPRPVNSAAARPTVGTGPPKRNTSAPRSDSSSGVAKRRKNTTVEPALSSRNSKGGVRKNKTAAAAAPSAAASDDDDDLDSFTQELEQELEQFSQPSPGAGNGRRNSLRLRNAASTPADESSEDDD